MPDHEPTAARRAAEEVMKYIARHTYSAFGNVASDWEEAEVEAIIARHESAKIERLRLIVVKMTEINAHFGSIINEIAKADLDEIEKKEDAPGH